MIKFVLGLGNPDDMYEHTLHNIGFQFVNYLAYTYRVPKFKKLSKTNLLVSELDFADAKVYLIKGLQWMNHSGLAAKTALRYFGGNTEELLVAYDDLDLNAGNVQIKFNANSAGHNGVGNILHHLQTKLFYRLRFGISNGVGKGMNYVLSRPGFEVKQLIDAAFDRAIKVIHLLANGNIERAQTILHTDNASTLNLKQIVEPINYGRSKNSK